MNKSIQTNNTQRLCKRFMFFTIPVLAGVFLYSGVVYSETVTVNPGAVLEQRAKLEEELKNLEEQINEYGNLIQSKQKEASSLERDIDIIDAQIKQSKLAIRARTITINNLSDQISDKTQLIGDLLLKYEREKESLAELLRQLNEFGDTSIIEMLLGYDNLSDFFVNIDSFNTLQEVLQNSFDDIKLTKASTEEERAALVERKTEESELKYIQELEKKRIEEREAERQHILQVTRGEEKLYQNMKSSVEKDAALIRSQLFLLRGSPNIPFEKALELANFAFEKTGVRPAFVLGIIAEESELGANLGSGNWKDDLYDCYIRIGYKTSAEKQKAAFLDITSELGLNPDLLPVSKAPYYGCGGAMGPAQFMPTTWQLYKDGVAKRTGNNPPNPWEPKDAFMAAALLLKDNGAAAGGYSAERRAALRYLAGGNWAKPAYAFYGDDVMALAEKYQGQIDILSR